MFIIFVLFFSPQKANLFSDIKKIQANMDDESESFRNEFKHYMNRVAEFSKSKQDQEEKMILK